MKRLLFIVLLLIPGRVFAADHAVTCAAAGAADRAAIQAAWDAAVDGDTVTISGTCGVFDQPVNMGSSTANPKTVIVRGTATIQVGASGVAARAFVIWNDGTKLPELTGLTIEQVAGGLQSSSQGAVEIRGNCSSDNSGRTRVHHMTFRNVRANVVNFISDGVFDSNVDYKGSPAGNRIFFRNGGKCTGSGTVAQQQGFTSGAASLELGTADGAYVENNIFWNCVPNAGETDCSSTLYNPDGLTDGEFGCRAVIRFNTWYNFESLTVHGTEGGVNRGCIKLEIYANRSRRHTLTSSRWTHLRSGNGVMWGNDVENVGTGHHFAGALATYRLDNGFFPYDAAPGTIRWGKCGGKSGELEFDLVGTSPIITGTHTGANAVQILVDGSKNFETYTHPAYSTAGIERFNLCNTMVSSTWYGMCGYVYANTATQAYMVRDHDRTTECTNTGSANDSNPCFNTNDTYEMRPVTACVDQPGYAPLTGTSTTMTTVSGGPSPNAWPNLVLTPFYAWLNTINDAVTPIEQNLSLAATGGPAMTLSNIIPEVHYYNQPDAVDADAFCAVSSGTPQTCGVRVDTFANRPLGCTAGVAYWATDRPVTSWNDGSNAIYTGKGELYKCTATDTWTSYYTPYTYPHPLATGADPGLNLNGVSPTFGSQNATTAITLTGVGFRGTDMGASTTVTLTKSGGSGLSTSMLSVASDTSITVNFVATAGATVGTWDVRVVTDEGTSNPQSYDVIASGAPSLTTVVPSTCYRNSSCPVTFTGTGFTSGTITETCSGIAFNSPVVVSDTVVTALAVVDNNASTVTCTVAITVSGSTSNTKDFQALSISGGPVGRLRAR